MTRGWYRDSYRHYLAAKRIKTKFLVPVYAKVAAQRGLEERAEYSESRKPGLDKQEAKKLGIASGVERAKQLIRSKSIPEEDAKRVAAFYQRFKNQRTPRAEVAMDLWGGRRFGRSVAAQVRERTDE